MSRELLLVRKLLVGRELLVSSLRFVGGKILVR